MAWYVAKFRVGNSVHNLAFILWMLQWKVIHALIYNNTNKEVNVCFIFSGFFFFFFQVSIQPLRETFKIDCTNVTLKAMPGLSSVHLQPNSFERMRVNLAFQLFGDRVINGLQFYKDRLEASWGSIDTTLSFFR